MTGATGAPIATAAGPSFVTGRAVELAALRTLTEPDGPRIGFVHGGAGMGKTTLLAAFLAECRELGLGVVTLDGRAIEPTERGFASAIGAATGAPEAAALDAAVEALRSAGTAVLAVDCYEVLRIADPWVRHSLLPALARGVPGVRVVVAGREPPMLEWATGPHGPGRLAVVRVGPLDEAAAREVVSAAGVPDPEAPRLLRLARGHPLALRLAVETWLAGRDLPGHEAAPRVVHALAAAFRDGLDAGACRALDAAAVPRRVTRDVLAAMLGPDAADEALDMLGRLSFVEAGPDGLRLHDAVQSAVAERLRAVDPETFRRHREAAWHHLRGQSRTAGRSELWRATADLLFLIDNPVVRESMFPTTDHLYSVEPASPADGDALRAIWHRHDTAEGAALLDAWWRFAPHAVRAVRDRNGTVVGCSVTCEWSAIPARLVRDDPVVAAWARDAARLPLPARQVTLVDRRFLDRDHGEDPGPVQAATWLAIKRDYFALRPRLGRLYSTAVDPEPLMPALEALGFRPAGEPVDVGGAAFHLAALDFGPDSVDGWLARVAARELGISERGLLDPATMTAHVDGADVRLTPLEFGVLAFLASRRGAPATRVELIEAVWGTTYTGGSNVVDVVVRGIRRKLGAHAGRVETVRGVGYRLVD